MKTSFLVTLLLAAAVCTHGKEVVLDSDGNPVKLGANYFIQTNIGRLGPGGLPFCPLHILPPFEDPRGPGWPISFAYDPVLVGTDYIYTSTSVNIKFEAESDAWGGFCDQLSRLWEVQGSSSAAKEHDVVLGGEPKSPNSAFKIEKAAGAHTYKLTTSYGTVGITRILVLTRLVVTNDVAKTIFVEFVKDDNDATTATTSTSRFEKSGLRMFPFY